jgi:hypothetical protein
MEVVLDQYLQKLYIDTGSSALSMPSKSRDMTDENNKILTEWK